MSHLLPGTPRLRPIEVIPVETGRGRGFALYDPRRIAPDPVVLTAGALFVLEQLNGQNTPPDIQANIRLATGHDLELDEIAKLIQVLDESLFLETPRFEAAERSLREEFGRLTSRPAAMAGSAYPSDPDELRAFMANLFEGDGGPGLPERNGHDPGFRALVAPHIDLARGGPCFATAYKALVEACDADTFVILGIQHAGDGRPYAVTAKSFETPLGPMPTDRGMVTDLLDNAPPGSLGDEFSHRNEHSVEFAALLLRYLYIDRERPAIVPILCGSLHGEAGDGEPIDRAEVAGFVDALRNAIDNSGKNVCVIASVDLAHVGRRFGDSQPADADVCARVESEDRQMLDAFASLDIAGFQELMTKDRDTRHVCGHPAMYTLMHLLGRGVVGTLLRYDQAVEAETESVVSFAAMTFGDRSA